MSRWAKVIVVFISGFLVLAGINPDLLAQSALQTAVRAFPARGVIMEIKPDAAQVIIRHEAISNYMEGMTMPFNIKDPAQLAGLQRGDQVTFQLHVTDDKSWVDHFQKIGTISLPQSTAEAPVSHPDRSILSYKFTNELGEAVSFRDFHGQALAITFFYTRCPLPDFCPRLSKNFQQAAQKLETMANAPTNWHFISVSFDPEFDTPQMLKSYGTSYGYDPAHWSFFTGPQEKIADLARSAGVEYSVDNGTINHNFRTLIVDPNGHLQTVFPTSGDLSDQIASEILKAMTVRPKSGLVSR